MSWKCRRSSNRLVVSKWYHADQRSKTDHSGAMATSSQSDDCGLIKQTRAGAARSGKGQTGCDTACLDQNNNTSKLQFCQVDLASDTEIHPFYFCFLHDYRYPAKVLMAISANIKQVHLQQRRPGPREKMPSPDAGQSRAKWKGKHAYLLVSKARKPDFDWLIVTASPCGCSDLLRQGRDGQAEQGQTANCPSQEQHNERKNREQSGSRQQIGE